MTAPQMSRCDQGHKGTTTANHTMSSGTNTRYLTEAALQRTIKTLLILMVFFFA